MVNGFKVFDKPCDECLFGPNKIVSDKRMQEVINGCVRDDSHFICHKASMNKDDICCRSFFERFTTNLERMCGRIGMLFLIDLEAYLKGEMKARKPGPDEVKANFDSSGRRGNAR